MSFSKFIFALFLVVSSCALAAQAPALLASVEGTPTIASPQITAPAEAELFTAATYPGGQAALLKNLNTNVEYPQLAREYSVEGTVVIRLSLDRNGRVTEQEIVRGLGFGCDEAATKAIAALGRFKPAKRGGQRSSSVVYVPLKFRLR